MGANDLGGAVQPPPVDPLPPVEEIRHADATPTAPQQPGPAAGPGETIAAGEPGDVAPPGHGPLAEALRAKGYDLVGSDEGEGTFTLIHRTRTEVPPVGPGPSQPPRADPSGPEPTRHSDPAGPGAPAPDAPGPEAARTHTVGENQTLFAVAKIYYGSGKLWPRIRDANPGKVTADGAVRSGVRLLIPGSGDSGAGRTPPSASPKRTAPPRPTIAQEPEPSKKAPTTAYTVRKGDTLSVIAQQKLGSMRRMAEIVKMNPGAITDAHTIRAGTVLRLPAS